MVLPITKPKDRMKTKPVKIPVGREQISFLADPRNQGHDTLYALVKVRDLPMDLPLDVNPRAQNTASRVARQIATGLVDDSDIFHILNRGLTVTAYDADYDPKKELLTLQLASGFYGVLDGGHTYAVIRENAEPYLNPEKALPAEPPPAKAEGETNNIEEKADVPPEFLDAFVRMEIIKGIKSDLVVDLARSRNTSAQVRDESLANLEGSFDWLKEVLAKTKFGELVAYKENEDDAKFPIDIREIIALLTLFHPNFQDFDHPPIMGYTSKGRCLDMFRDDAKGYESLKPIIGDILKLYDYVHLKFADLYKEIGGFSAIGEDIKPRTQRGVKLAKVTGVKAIKEGFPLYYLDEKAFYRFPDGWLFPVIAAMRGIASYRQTVKWKADPFKFFDKVGKNLVSMTLETSLALGRNPNAVGKSRAHWIQLYERVTNAYLKMLNVDVEQEVKL